MYVCMYIYIYIYIYIYTHKALTLALASGIALAIFCVMSGGGHGPARGVRRAADGANLI